MAAVPVHEAVEWREPAPGGGSQAQVFRLADGRFAVVKFPENPQGELVLANEFMCCHLAEALELPVNRAILVSIDERLLRLPRQQNQIPPQFSAGVRCGMVRFENAEATNHDNIANHCDNPDELHAVAVFEQLVCRLDGRQLLMYPEGAGNKGKRFAAYDYGFAFGGQPQWSDATIANMPPVTLPVNDPFSGKPYNEGTFLAGPINRLRDLSVERVRTALQQLHPPRWGATEQAVAALAPAIAGRAKALVDEYDKRFEKQQKIEGT